MLILFTALLFGVVVLFFLLRSMTDFSTQFHSKGAPRIKAIIKIVLLIEIVIYLIVFIFVIIKTLFMF